MNEDVINFEGKDFPLSSISEASQTRITQINALDQELMRLNLLTEIITKTRADLIVELRQDLNTD